MQQQHTDIMMIATGTTTTATTTSSEPIIKNPENYYNSIITSSLSTVATPITQINNGICCFDNFNTELKTSPLSMPSGVVIMQPKNNYQPHELNFYTENLTNNNNDDNNENVKNEEKINQKQKTIATTSDNAKELLIKSNFSHMDNINKNNYNLNNNSHYNDSYFKNNNNNNVINNSKNNIKNKKTCVKNNKSSLLTNTTIESAFNRNLNSDNNNKLINNYHNNNTNVPRLNRCINIEQNGWNTIITTIVESNEPITTTTTTSTINNDKNNSNINNKNNIEINNHENAYTNQRRYVEDVHNYSKKSNRFEFSSSGSNNTTSSDYDDDSDNIDNYDDADDELIQMNKINNKKQFSNETDNSKWLKNVKSRNECKSSSIAMQNNCIDNNNKNNIILNNDNKNNRIDNDKSKTPDSGIPDDYDKLTPDHHARRPMNAFLIFCKRHRAIVRDKYKNVENRQITKILGEWWANMTNDEKSCYANLAKENKDAFLSANPNFKWYKLPAPPLRTLSTRPLNNHSSTTSDISSPYKNDENKQLLDVHLNENEITNASISQQLQHHNKKPLSPTTTVSTTPTPLTKQKQIGNNVGMFKFADETQMGGLNSLMFGNSPASDSNKSSSSNSNQQQDKIPENELLQNALGETSNFLSTTLQEPFENMRDHALKMKKTGIKRKLTTTTTDISISGVVVKKALRDNSSFSSSEEDNINSTTNRKLSRSCKGKKYQELINSGQIANLYKKTKKQNLLLSNDDYQDDDDNNGDDDDKNLYLKDSSSDSDYYNNFSIKKNHRKNINIKNKNITKAIATTTINSPISFEHNQKNINDLRKPFDMIDFDLDSKIMALPAQCLEQYLLKKQESKSKKKINSKRHKINNSNNNASNSNNKKLLNFSSNLITMNNSGCNNGSDIKSPVVKTIQEMKEQIVGSQKRKARKESITRRDVNAIQNETKKLLLNSLVQFNENSGGNCSSGTTIPTTNDSRICGVNANESILLDVQIPIELSIIKEENMSEQEVTLSPYRVQNQNLPIENASDLFILAEVASIVDD